MYEILSKNLKKTALAVNATPFFSTFPGKKKGIPAEFAAFLCSMPTSAFPVPVSLDTCSYSS